MVRADNTGSLRKHLFRRMAAEQKAVGRKEEGQQDNAGDERSMEGDSEQLAGLPLKFAYSIQQREGASSESAARQSCFG